jgi:Galactose oxidase, central domain
VLITGGKDSDSDELIVPPPSLPPGGLNVSGVNASASSSYVSVGNLASAELFDPATGQFTPCAQPMSEVRTGHTATLLLSGLVLIAGGWNSEIEIASADLYDPAADTFTKLANSLNKGRDGHTATLLPNGQVLLAGGWVEDADSELGYAVGSDAELYDPQAQTFTVTGSLLGARYNHTATLLANGAVLMIGGNAGNGNKLYTAESYDAATGAFTSVGNLNVGRSGHTASLLADGTVLIAGGIGSGDGYGMDDAIVMPSADPMSSATTVPMGTSADSLPTYTSPTFTEIYDPALKTFRLGANLVTARTNHTATVLDQGQVLIVDGEASNGTALLDVELYDPANPGAAATLPVPVIKARAAMLKGANGQASISNCMSGFTYAWSIQGGTLLPAPPIPGLVFFGADAVAGQLILSCTATSPAGAVLTAVPVTIQVVDTPITPQISSFTASATSIQPGQSVTFNWTTQNATRVYIRWVGGSEATAGSMSYSPQEPNVYTLTAYNDDFGTSVMSAPIIVTVQEAAGAVSAQPSMTTARFFHTSTLLQDGKVLLVGGRDENRSGTSSAEVFDPATGQFQATAGALHSGRDRHTATLLLDGKVLVVGGESSEPTKAELYDPTTGTFAYTQNASQQPTVLKHQRSNHTATLLSNGKVLIVGGLGGGSMTATAELYNPATQTFSDTGSLNTGRCDHTATLLPDGKVLVTGGRTSPDSIVAPAATAELYDPATGVFTPATGNMGLGRARHTATLLPNGKVLVAGGISNFSMGGEIASGQLYDPATQLFSTTSSLAEPRSYATATLLADGNVLFGGGFSGDLDAKNLLEIFQPTGPSFRRSASLATGRTFHAATMLPSGKVLFTGGLDSSATVLASAELFDPMDSPSYPAFVYANTIHVLNEGVAASIKPLTNDTGLVWSLGSGVTLPAGLSLNAATGEISGTPEGAAQLDRANIGNRTSSSDAPTTNASISNGAAVYRVIVTKGTQSTSADLWITVHPAVN